MFLLFQPPGSLVTAALGYSISTFQVCSFISQAPRFMSSSRTPVSPASHTDLPAAPLGLALRTSRVPPIPALPPSPQGLLPPHTSAPDPPCLLCSLTLGWCSGGGLGVGRGTGVLLPCPSWCPPSSGSCLLSRLLLVLPKLASRPTSEATQSPECCGAHSVSARVLDALLGPVCPLRANGGYFLCEVSVLDQSCRLKPCGFPCS